MMVLSPAAQPSSGALQVSKASKEPVLSWGFPMPLTPPSSPILDSGSPDDQDFDCCFRIQPICGIYDDITEEHAYAQSGNIDVPLYRAPGKSVVIKDCMWGHWSAHDVNLHQQDGEPRNKMERPAGLSDSIDDAMDPTSAKLVGVDPSEVFPHHEDAIRVHSLSDCSDSEDDSDIDVVTVENSFPLSENTTKPVSPSILSPPKTPDAEVSSGCDFQGLSIKSPFCKSPTKVKLDVPHAVVKSLSALADKQNSRSPRKHLGASGDVKFSRTSHNVLERKRRNELKMRFFNLRDAIPELSENDKVPKVTILKQAILYVRSLKTEETVLLAEHQRQRKQNGELRRRLAALLKNV